MILSILDLMLLSKNCVPFEGLFAYNGNETRGQWFVALRHVKLRWKVQLSAIGTRQVYIVNTYKVY